MSKYAHCKNGFTLFEVLAVFALIAMLSTIAVVNFSFLDNMGARPVEAVLKNAVRAARAKADLRGRETALFFDSEKSEFLIADYETGEELLRMPLFDTTKDKFESEEKSAAAPAEKSGIAISFIPVFPESENSFDSDFGNIETIESPRFYPDGASTECEILIDYKNGVQRRLKLDAFAEVPVEYQEK